MRYLKEFAPLDIWKRQFAWATRDTIRRTWIPEAPLPFEPVYASLYSWHETPPNVDMPIIHEIVWDFDSPAGMLDLAQTDTVRFLQYLMEIHDVRADSLGVYFSGSKGFHVVMPIEIVVEMEDESGLWGVKPSIIKAFAVQLATGFRTFDSSVYDSRRIFRMPEAPHGGTGLYKTPLTYGDLMAMMPDDIRAYAAEKGHQHCMEDPDTSNSLYEMILQVSETSAAAECARPANSLTDLFNTATPGERNVRATQLAGLLVKAVDDLPMVREVMRLWNRQLQYPLSLHELDVITTGCYQRYHTNTSHNTRTKHVEGF